MMKKSLQWSWIHQVLCYTKSHTSNSFLLEQLFKQTKKKSSMVLQFILKKTKCISCLSSTWHYHGFNPISHRRIPNSWAKLHMVKSTKQNQKTSKPHSPISLGPMQLGEKHWLRHLREGGCWSVLKRITVSRPCMCMSLYSIFQWRITTQFFVWHSQHPNCCLQDKWAFSFLLHKWTIKLDHSESHLHGQDINPSDKCGSLEHSVIKFTLYAHTQKDRMRCKLRHYNKECK